MTRISGSSRALASSPASLARTLYVVDVENMAGSADLSVRDVAIVKQRLLAAVPTSPGDQTVLAISHHNGEAALFGWKVSAERKFRSGRDGADLALLESIQDTRWVADRFDRVVIASGDHAFALTARALRTAGLDVLVVSPDVGMSPALRRAAEGNVVTLGSTHPLQIIPLTTSSKDAA